MEENDTDNLKYEYKNFTISLFHNSGRWDYHIPELTSETPKRKKELYETKDQALKNAKIEIDNY